MLMRIKGLGPVVQSVISLTSLLRVISLTVLADSIHNILIFLLKKCECKSYSHFFSKKFQHICVSLDVNFNESLTNDVVSFEQLGPEMYNTIRCAMSRGEVVSITWSVNSQQFSTCINNMVDLDWHSVDITVDSRYLEFQGTLWNT